MTVNISAIEDNNKFQAAKPFPHIITDDLFSVELCKEFLDDLPSTYDPIWRHRSTTTSEKWTCPLDIDGSKSHEKMDNALRSLEMLDCLRSLSGLENLVPSKGASVSRIDHGGFLHVHTDSGQSEQGYRVINLLVYLNPIWYREWGCCLSFCDAKGKVVQKIVPVIGRTVIFLNVKNAWHGHPERVKSSNVSRYALQQYYISTQSIGNESTSTYYRQSKRQLRTINND